MFAKNLGAMKLTHRFKLILLTSLGLMYATGLLTWITSQFFLNDRGFGREPSPLRVVWLDSHAVSGLWFLALFGYMFHSHIFPALKRKRKIKSGLLLTVVLALLSLSVPGLYYFTSESARAGASWLHTYLGLGALGFFLAHYYSTY